MRAICLHGHYYQPPREDPWLGVAPPEPSAAPDRDWNTRIARECYAPAAAARLLNDAGWLRGVLNLYEWTSFDAAPTLLAWLEPHAPEVLAAIRAGDAASRARTGFGNAWAQPFVHAILPLASPRDIRTHIHWGRRNFEHYFGRSPEGMWLPEMAVDDESLQALAEAGVALTMLAPHQAAAVRPLGASDDAWVPVTATTLDIRQVYRCVVAGGRTIDVLFRDARRSQDIAFGALLRDGTTLARTLEDGLGADDDGILSIAVDGETYGHHHRFAEMAVAFAIDLLRRRDDVVVTNPAAYAAAHPPRYEVAIAADTSWSCAHGLERWRSDCGCRSGTEAGWSQAWRTPLRTAIDWLRDELAVAYETRGAEQLRDPWGARDRYVDCLLAPGRIESFVADEGRLRLSPGNTVRARCALEMARHALLMQTSCGWFFDDLAGIEPLLVLRHAARAIDLAERLGRSLEAGFLDRLAPARSNQWISGNGADLYRARVRAEAPSSARVGATAGLLRLLGHTAEVPGYVIQLPEPSGTDRLEADVPVAEASTGLKEHVRVLGQRWPDGTATCEVDGVSYGLGDLLLPQHEAVLQRLADEVRQAARIEQAPAMAVAQLLVAATNGTPVPVDLLRLMGEAETESLVADLAEAQRPAAALIEHARVLQARGVPLGTEALARALGNAVRAQIAGLPETAPEIDGLMELATVTGSPLDLGAVQVALASWWDAALPSPRRDPSVRQLLDRLRVAPEEESVTSGGDVPA